MRTGQTGLSHQDADYPPHGPTYSHAGEYDDAPTDEHRVAYGDFTLVYDDAEHSHIPTVSHNCANFRPDNAGYLVAGRYSSYPVGSVHFVCYECEQSTWWTKPD